MAATAFTRRDVLPPPLTIPGQKFPFLVCLDEGSQAKGWTMPEMMTHLCFSEGFWGGKEGKSPALLCSASWHVEPGGKWIFGCSSIISWETPRSVSGPNEPKMRFVPQHPCGLGCSQKKNRCSRFELSSSCTSVVLTEMNPCLETLPLN